MKIYITRHSKTIWNSQRRLQGWQDSPLTKQGIEDAIALQKRIDDIPISLCYSSPILRARHTSEILFDKDMICFDDRLKEMNFGDYEGLFVKDIIDTPIYHTLWHQPRLDVCLPNGETYQQVRSRLLEFLDDIYNKHAKDTIFLTMHGMTFNILLGIVENTPIEQTHQQKRVIRGCSLSLVTYNGDNYDVEYIGDESHLYQEETPITYM